jgi:hypothetical protein
MTSMATDVEITLSEQLQTFVRAKQELPLALHPAVTVGVAPIPMVMDGLTWVIHLFTNQPNRETPMATVLEIPKTVTKAMPALKFVALRFLIDLAAVIQMAMVGLTQPIVGKPIRTVQLTLSRLNRFNGETPMEMVSAMFLWGLFETTVRKHREFPIVIHRVVLIQMATDGLIHTVNFQPQLRF